MVGFIYAKSKGVMHRIQFQQEIKIRKITPSLSIQKGMTPNRFGNHANLNIFYDK